MQGPNWGVTTKHLCFLHIVEPTTIDVSTYGYRLGVPKQLNCEPLINISRSIIIILVLSYAAYALAFFGQKITLTSKLCVVILTNRSDLSSEGVIKKVYYVEKVRVWLVIIATQNRMWSRISLQTRVMSTLEVEKKVIKKEGELNNSK